jgi:tetratricopeptide (TPR) repeat protein
LEKKHLKITDRAFYLSLIFAFSFILANIKVKDPDAFIHIKLGEFAVQNHTIPDRDPFVYTYTDSQYNNSAWLSQIIYYYIFKKAGFTGLIIFNAIIVGCTYALLFWVTQSLGLSNFLSIIFLLTISYASKERFVLRPHIFSLLFLSITVYLTQIDSLKKRFFLFFVLFLFWANLHAGFVYGLILLGCCFGGSIIKRIFGKSSEGLKPSVLNFAGAITGSVITPVPLAGYRFSTGLVNLKSTADVLEWRTLIGSHYTFLTVVVILCIVFFLFNWRKNEIKDWLILFIFVPSGFWAYRNAYELLIVVTPYAVSGLSEFLKLVKFKEKLNPNPLIEIIPLILVSLYLYDFKLDDYYSLIGHGINPKYYPSGAINYLKKIKVEGNIFNSFNFGGALAFEFYPERKIFIDGLSSGIALDFLAEYVKATEDGEKFEKFAGDYNISIVIVESDRGYITREIFNTKKWKMIYWDDNAMILVRSDMLPEGVMTIDVGDPSDIIYEAMSVPVENSLYLLKELNKSKNISDSFMVNLALGLLLRRQGRLNDAIDMLENAFSKQPFSFLCMYMLAESYKETGYTAAAKWLFERILFLNGGISGFSDNPFRLKGRDIERIKNELKNLEAEN